MIRIRCYYKGSSTIKQLSVLPCYNLSEEFNQDGQEPCAIHIFWGGKDTVDTMTDRDTKSLTKAITHTLSTAMCPDGQLILSPELQVKLGFV